MENKEIAKVEESKAINGFISEAIAKGLPVETMEKLFNLRERAKSEFAREEFMKSMANFQKVCPVIEKKKEVKGKNGEIRYKYAPLDSIVEQVKKPLGENLLSYDFTTEDLKDFLNVTCTVTHVYGHSKSSSFKIPIGVESFMTDAQKYGARLTFAKRYAFCNAFGILTSDEDTDVTEEKKPEMPTNTKAKIVAQLKQLGEDVGSAEKIHDAVTKLTKLSAVGDEKHLQEVSSRLAVLISEKNESGK